MTNLKDIQGLNVYCGPAVLSALTGKSTDECVGVISSISGKREIKAVDVAHLIKALEKLRFDVTKFKTVGYSLFGTLSELSKHEGQYIVLVPHHVVAVEVLNSKIYLIDNHNKSAIDASSSARLTQRVEQVYKVSSKGEMNLVRSEIKLYRGTNCIHVNCYNHYEDKRDNTNISLGTIRFRNDKELEDILYSFHSWYEGSF